MDFVGGCQCGAVRYRAVGPRDRASVCYCRMCQKAAGAPFMAFVRFRSDQVAWSTQPAIFKSSNQIERGFCAACGTPLSYHHVGGPNISLTIHSLDDPAAVSPEMSFSPAAAPAWCMTLNELPGTEMDLTDTAGFMNHQHPDHPPAAM